jgi:hypothetical protein
MQALRAWEGDTVYLDFADRRIGTCRAVLCGVTYRGVVVRPDGADYSAFEPNNMEKFFPFESILQISHPRKT